MTVLLVTHFMEEAERLCDRVAVIDAGRVVAVDTPAGLARAGRRRAADAVPAVRAGRRGRLLALPEVRTRRAARRAAWRSPATPNVIGAVTAYLARRQIIAAELRVEQGSLDDAFIALTMPRHRSEA